MIFLMRGTSCSGKDKFCDEHFESHCVLSSDQIRLQLTNDMKDQSKNAIVFDHLRSILELRLRFGCMFTTVNSTNIKFKDTVEYIDMAKKFGAGVTVISIDPPSVEELLQRRNKRVSEGGLYVPDEVFEKHHAGYFNGMPRFIEAQGDYINYKFVRIDQDWNIVK